MRVEIINKEELVNLYKTHGLFACTCYNTPDKFAEKVGKACNEDGHMSGSRTEYIKFRIYDVDRGTAEQIMRHEIGTDYDWNTYSYQDRMEIQVTLLKTCSLLDMLIKKDLITQLQKTLLNTMMQKSFMKS